jgi:hypothetical protein
MDSAGLRILRCAPWLAVLASAGPAGALLWLAGLRPHGTLALGAAVLGIALCAACAAFVLDDDALDLADATPTSRGRRAGWRAPIVLAPMAIAVVGLAHLDRGDPGVHWLRLAPAAVGAIASGLALASGLRRAGTANPGDLAAPVAFMATLLVVAVDPLRRWLPLVPLGASAYPMRSALAWTVIAATAITLTVLTARDPGRPVRHR